MLFILYKTYIIVDDFLQHIYSVEIHDNFLNVPMLKKLFIQVKMIKKCIGNFTTIYLFSRVY